MKSFTHKNLQQTIKLLTLALVAVLTASAASAAGVLVPSGRSRDVESQSLRIVDHLVTAKINHGIALTTVNQTFENTTNQRLEATYIFPIPEGADITDFRMSFNGKMVKGEVLPAEQARKIYEDIVRRQRDPGLIEFIGRRLLRARIFPIEPHSTTEIQISYQQIIDQVSGMNRYRYPLRTPGNNSRAYGTVRFSVDLETQAPLKAVWSPSHSVEVIREGEHHARIAYEKSGATLDEDFLLLYDTDDKDVGMSLVTDKPQGEDAGHFLMILSPKALWDDDVNIPQDFVFVVDTSGSMAGEKIKQARKALSYCVNRLNDEDRFNIVRFSTGFEGVFDTLQYADESHRDKAIKAIDRFKATGGTNIYGALEEAVGMYEANDKARPFIIVFLTDGLGDRSRDDIDKMLNEKTNGFKAEVRLFPFGVGNDVNTKLLDSLATNYGGTPTYVQPGEDLEQYLGDFFAVFSQPVLTDVRLSFPDDAGISERFPPVAGDIYHGKQLILAGQYENPVTGRVILTGMRGDEKVRYVWDSVSFAPSADTEYVSRIWAGRKIAYLLDRIRLVGESDEMVDEVVKLATRYGIQTPYTSWLVTPGNESRRGMPLAIRRRAGNAGRGSFNDTSFGMAEGGAAEVAAENGGNGMRRDVPSASAPAAWDLDDASGKGAVNMAKSIASMRQGGSLDASRNSTVNMVMRHINGRDYWNVRGVLVDVNYNEKAKTIDIKFGSDAYFDIVLNRPDLRKVFAAAQFVIVMVNKDTAVFVHPKSGLKELPDDVKAQIW